MADYPQESQLDKFIKDFVYKRTAEKVELTLKAAISIRCTSKRGSIVVATFWANVLQHPSNFPKEQFPYKELHDSTTGGTKLIGKAEDVTFTVFMGNGTLMMQGKFVYEWFTRRFRELIQAADPEFCKDYEYVASPVEHLPASQYDKEPLGDIQTETEDYLLMRNQQYSELPPIYNLMPEGSEDLISRMGNLNIDQQLFHGDDLDAELEGLCHGGMRDGFSYIYKLWKSLLEKWYSTIGTDIYMASPFLDAERLEDLIKVLLRHRTRGQLSTFFTRQACDSHGQKQAAEVKRTAAANYTAEEKTLIEYKLYRRVVYPVKRFHGKFIAGVKDGNAEVLITSANFHANHFAVENMETVLFVRMSQETFEKEYLDPITAPVVART